MSLQAFDTQLQDTDFNLTPAAAEKMSSLLSEMDEEAGAIRLFVSGGGCDGMTYGMTFTDQKTDYDTEIKGDGFSIYVDAVALNFLRGAEVDYVERPTGASFVFNNVFQAIGGAGVCGTCGAAGGGCG